MFCYHKTMIKHIAVVGAGINGLLTAFLIAEKCPVSIDIYDAEKHPTKSADHKGVTHGSRDARHITGSESICFESSIHKLALRRSPEHSEVGWLLKRENKLTPKEKRWRELFEESYIGVKSPTKLDFAHAKLNYQGMKAWIELTQKYPFINDHIINSDGVEVYFQDKMSFDADLAMETEFCRRYFNESKVLQAQNEILDKLYDKKIIVPGFGIRLKSLAQELIKKLEANPKVSFHWEETVVSSGQLQADLVVWTSGVTHVQPKEYNEYNVQGIVGCWATVPNRGFDVPFKIAAPVPSAYMNLTPDGKDLHVSGGFGWTGEYADISDIKPIAKPVAKHFVNHVNNYLGTSLTTKDVDYCIRPSTPTGQPLLLTKRADGKTHVYVSGSAKSGTTHAPILSEFVLSHLTTV